MTERPILFKGEMVSAVLDGRKTQTRRIVPERMLEKYYDYDEYCNAVMPSDIPCTRDYEKKFFMDRVPYGAVGDRLWVKETHCFVADGLLGVIPGIVYAADDTKIFNNLESLPNGVTVYNYDKPEIWRWRPSIFTHRWASRITLEITGVRCERLQDITEEDAIAEGAEPLLVPPDGGSCPHIEGYHALWESINGAGSWDANPYVWRIEFKLLPAAQAEPTKGAA